MNVFLHLLVAFLFSVPLLVTFVVLLIVGDGSALLLLVLPGFLLLWFGRLNDVCVLCGVGFLQRRRTTDLMARNKTTTSLNSVVEVKCQFLGILFWNIRIIQVSH